MSDQGKAEDADTEFIVEDKDEFIARKSLEDLFEHMQAANNALTAVRLASQNLGGYRHTHRRQALAEARIKLIQLIEQLRPRLEGTELWTDRDLGDATVEGWEKAGRTGYDETGMETAPDREVSVTGLEELYAIRNGIPVSDSSGTQVRRREVPMPILEAAYAGVREWLVDQDLALPIDEEAPHDIL